MRFAEPTFFRASVVVRRFNSTQNIECWKCPRLHTICNKSDQFAVAYFKLLFKSEDQASRYIRQFTLDQLVDFMLRGVIIGQGTSSSKDVCPKHDVYLLSDE